MAYTVDAVQAKLSGLNETQESIVTVAQWVMFHRRHADKTALLWKDHMNNLSSSKRLNMIYLANEVVQQSKARRKEEFTNAFSPIIVEATELAYKGASHEIQQKIRRVMEVWRHRNIFDTSVLDALEAKVDELDRAKASIKKPGLGGSLFNSAVSSGLPAELQPLATLQTTVSKAEATSKPAITNATTEFEKLIGTSGGSSGLAPPVLASRLSGLLKSLATADSTIGESIRARQRLIEGLAKLIETNKKALNEAQLTKATIEGWLDATEAKRREVEDNIMAGLSPLEPGTSRENGDAESEPVMGTDFVSAGMSSEAQPISQASVSSLVSVFPTSPENVTPIAMPDVSNILASLAPPQESKATSAPPSGLRSGGETKPSTKRRRIESSEYDDPTGRNSMASIVDEHSADDLDGKDYHDNHNHDTMNATSISPSGDQGTLTDFSPAEILAAGSRAATVTETAPSPSDLDHSVDSMEVSGIDNTPAVSNSRPLSPSGETIDATT